MTVNGHMISSENHGNVLKLDFDDVVLCKYTKIH